MNYRFYYPDWNSRKDICEDYPEIKEITREPIAFWYGVGPKRNIRKTKKSIQRLLKRAHPYLPVLVIYSIPNRDLGQALSQGAEVRPWKSGEPGARLWRRVFDFDRRPFHTYFVTE